MRVFVERWSRKARTRGTSLGRGKGYVYPHDDAAGFDVDYLPDPLKGRIYYSED